MKVLLVNGSPHENGCVYTSLKEVADTLEENGISAEIHWIGKGDIAGCKGCGYCKSKGKCVIDDDVNSIGARVDEFDGFIFGAPLAERFHKPFVPVRKMGKLPRKTVSQSYALEYGTATIEMHEDAVKPGQRVVLVDDLLATGGTMAAACSLVERLGGIVAQILFVVELAGFRARETTLAGRPVKTLLVYEGK